MRVWGWQQRGKEGVLRWQPDLWDRWKEREAGRQGSKGNGENINTENAEKGGRAQGKRREIVSHGILWCGYSCWGLIAEEEAIVDYACYDAAQERADPVDAVVGPVMSGEGWAEGAGGVHGAACEGAGEEDVHGDG